MAIVILLRSDAELLSLKDQRSPGGQEGTVVANICRTPAVRPPGLARTHHHGRGAFELHSEAGIQRAITGGLEFHKTLARGAGPERSARRAASCRQSEFAEPPLRDTGPLRSVTAKERHSMMSL